MLRAERRRRVDLVVAALIALLVLVCAVVVVLTSPAAHTTSITATGPEPSVPAAPAEVPGSLTEVWRQSSPMTSAPVVAGPVVVTGSGSTVTGRNPLTGAQLWLYRRNLPLCAVGAGWGMAIAMFRHGSYCSEVTALRADSGMRGPQRNSDVPPNTQLLWDGDRLTATGSRHLETWRSDLVKTLEYGQLRAEIEPDTQPRPNCLHTSVAVASGLVGVVERCPHEPGDRLTVMRPDNADSDSPDEVFSTILPTTGARLVALSADHEAVLLPNPTRLSVRDSNGNEVASYPLNLPASALTTSLTSIRAGSSGTAAGSRATVLAPAGSAGAAAAATLHSPRPPGTSIGEVVPTTAIPGAVLWWTGTSTIALDADDLHPVWTLPGTLGPGTLLADQPVIPSPGAELLVNPADGSVVRTMPVNRGDYRGPVRTASLGPILLEQRGSTIVALR